MDFDGSRVVGALQSFESASNFVDVVGVIHSSPSSLISGVEDIVVPSWSPSFNRRSSCERVSKQFANDIRIFSSAFRCNGHVVKSSGSESSRSIRSFGIRARCL